MDIWRFFSGHSVCSIPWYHINCFLKWIIINWREASESFQASRWSHYYTTLIESDVSKVMLNNIPASAPRCPLGRSRRASAPWSGSSTSSRRGPTHSSTNYRLDHKSRYYSPTLNPIIIDYEACYSNVSKLFSQSLVSVHSQYPAYGFSIFGRKYLIFQRILIYYGRVSIILPTASVTR